MPAFYSHFSFGIQGYKRIADADLKSVIKRHQTVYTMGLLGPDLFFYFLPDVMFGRKKPAIVMHEYKTNLFFENLLKEMEVLPGLEREIACAYIAGFMGHYAMDVACHPYIYEMAAKHDNPSSWHYTYESAMDIYCCRHFLHRYPAQIRQHRLLHLSPLEMRTVCRLASRAYNKTYRLPYTAPFTIKGAIGCMHVTIALLNDKKGRKESFINKLESRLLGYGLISPLFVNFNMYQMDRQEIAHFMKLFHQGQEQFAKYLEKLAVFQRILPDKSKKIHAHRRSIGFLAEKAAIEARTNRQRTDLLKCLGNRSYHTGKPCNPAYLIMRK